MLAKGSENLFLVGNEDQSIYGFRDITDIIRFAYNGEDGALFLHIYYKLGAEITKVEAEAAAGQGRGPILDIVAESPDLSAWSSARRCKPI